MNTADAIARFDAAFPDAKKVRDVLEHLEDYELGVGDLQVPGQRRLEFLYCSDDEGMSYMELQGVGVRREAHAVVRRLVKDTGAEIAAVLDA